MVHYKLYYFPFRSRGEAIRQLFHLAGVQYEEVTIQLSEWPLYKAQMPLGQMPVLEVEGQKIGQTTAILRFLGHQFHRCGNGPLECAKLDMISELVQELSSTKAVADWGKVLFGMIPGDKDEYFRDQVQPEIDRFAPQLEKFIIENGNGLFVGNTESWVDVFAAEMLVRFRDFGPSSSLDAFPHIDKLIQRVQATPAIARYINNRPHMPF